MVKHIILWTLKDMSQEEKEKVKAGIKEGWKACRERFLVWWT